MRTEFIKTKVRPIKKLFVIERDDYESFANVFTQIQGEIDAIQNLILLTTMICGMNQPKSLSREAIPTLFLISRLLMTTSYHFISAFSPLNQLPTISKLGDLELL